MSLDLEAPGTKVVWPAVFALVIPPGAVIEHHKEVEL